ncbi:hypothetical protein [Streptomyces sp. NPDC001315]|uniref:hypothetical protein n=1 Tax=Streptomyces sp. NPDC001315 TaxID=3364562 RepID=UPI0036963E89
MTAPPRPEGARPPGVRRLRALVRALLRGILGCLVAGGIQYTGVATAPWWRQNFPPPDGPASHRCSARRLRHLTRDLRELRDSQDLSRLLARCPDPTRAVPPWHPEG